MHWHQNVREDGASMRPILALVHFLRQACRQTSKLMHTYVWHEKDRDDARGDRMCGNGTTGIAFLSCTVVVTIDHYNKCFD